MNERKRIIGYTSGVFDLFHIGHLNILKKARENCDYLIVGVSTDALVEAYKHKRVIIPFKERIAIIQAIKYVDKAVEQDTLDKLVAWEKYRFNRLFHGDDWKGSSLYEETEKRLEAVNVEVIFFPYTINTSSTLVANALYHDVKSN